MKVQTFVQGSLETIQIYVVVPVNIAVLLRKKRDTPVEGARVQV